MAKYSFDVQTRVRDRWVTEAICETEREAREIGTRFLMDSQCAGIRIVRNYHKANDLQHEIEIFKEIRDVKDSKPSRINDIDDASPICETEKDLTAYESRHTMGRLFRNYLSATSVTPIEVIHNYRELIRIQDKGQLVRSGVDRVADLQSAKIGVDHGERRSELFRCIDNITGRASAVAGARLPSITGTFSELLAGLANMPVQEDPEYLANTVLARHLLDLRSWAGKLELLCNLIEKEPDPRATELLDDALADVLGTDIIQELLGYQSTLGAAISAMLDLASGSLRDATPGAQEFVAQLNALFAAKRLPFSRRCIVQRAHRQLRSGNPLHPRDPAQEISEFRRVLLRLTTPDGLLEGPITAEAITTRFARTGELGGLPGRLNAVTAAVEAMPETGIGIVYLSALSQCDDAAPLMSRMCDLLKQLLSVRSIVELGQSQNPAAKQMQSATRAFNALSASHFPAAVRDKALARIDDLLEEYVIAERIVEKIDRPGLHLRERARLLVRFCGSGLLPEGKALRRARKTSLDLIRQPNFEALFVEGIADPREAEAALRAFHRDLRDQPGFMR